MFVSAAICFRPVFKAVPGFGNSSAFGPALGLLQTDSKRWPTEAPPDSNGTIAWLEKVALDSRTALSSQKQNTCSPAQTRPVASTSWGKYPFRFPPRFFFAKRRLKLLKHQDSRIM